MRLSLVSSVLAAGIAGCDTRWTFVDADGDGFSALEGDCWDRPEGPPGTGLGGADIHPDAADAPYDGVDADCSGDDDYDLDGDGWVTDDAHLGAPTLGAPDAAAGQLGSGDCDDLEAAVNPGAVERCDALDNDCDALIDDEDPDLDASTGQVFHADADADGYGDAASTVAACVAPEGYVADARDCDDARADVNPEGQEVCDYDDTDEDCDGRINSEDDSLDADSALPWYRDGDGDGYGTDADVQDACERPDGYADNAEDCDDAAADVNPGAPEVCDGGVRDENCNGLTDDADPSLATVDPAVSGASPWYTDGDGDSYGVDSTEVLACVAPPGAVSDPGDCDDLDVDIHPGAQEVCDADDTDEDCDELADDNDPSVDASGFRTVYADGDRDGWGDAGAPLSACDPPTAGYADASGDCDDGDGSVNPDAQEVCDAADVDEDCDGLADDADGSVSGQTTWYVDDDSDGYGDPAGGVAACDAPGGRVADDTDCDDGDGDVNPGAQEVCDADDTDEDCDGLADDDDPTVSAATRTTWYPDDDGDGFGDASAGALYCDPPADGVSDGTDCDDGDADINPDATEVCNDGADNDCDGTLGTRDAAAAFSTCAYSDATAAVAHHALSGTNDRRYGAAFALGDADNDGDVDLLVSSIGRSNKKGRVHILHPGAELQLSPDEASVTTGSPGERMEGPTNADTVGAALALGAFSTTTASEVFTFVGASGANAASGSALSRGTVYLLSASADWTTDGDIEVEADALADGHNTDDALGTSLSAAGDWDGDGVVDLLVGAPGRSSSGIAYLLTADTYASSGLSDSSGYLAADFQMDGNNADAAGTEVLLVDLNGDAQAEAVVGAPEAFVASETRAGGVAYIVENPGSGSSLSLSGEPGFEGPTSGTGGMGGDCGLALAAGDLDGDGLADLLVGCRGARSAGGTVAVVLGASGLLSGTITSSATLQGSSGEQAGASVAVVGDVDGDTVPDVVVGAPYSAAGASDAGAIYLVSGPISGAVSLSTSASVAQLTGEAADDLFGGAVAGGADLDGDGLADFVAGATESGTALNGTAYVFLGLSW